MSKIYKSNNKLVVYLPFDVINALNVKDGDEVDFFKFSGKSFLFAKKNDVVDLLTKLQEQPHRQEQAPQAQGRGSPTLDRNEVALLKKLDTLRYSDRTRAKVESMLNDDEKQVLKGLMSRKVVIPFRKSNDQEYRYSISKDVYDAFLYRKGKESAPQAPQQVGSAPKPVVKQPMMGMPRRKEWERRLSADSTYLDLLESKGFIVLLNEAEASSASAALEDSIRHGLVIGTRAFNKRFYIALRGFINKNTPKIMKVITDKSASVDEISRETGVEPDGIRAILYILSESGDVSEVRRDTFKSA